VKNQLRNPHQLILDHKEEIIYRKKRDKELKQASFNSNYYTTVKSKYRENEPILPIYVSDSNINRAYRIMDALINILGDMEGRIRVTREGDRDIGGFILLHTIFYFELRDEIKKGNAKGGTDEPARKLICIIKAQGWFNQSLIHNFQYKDTDDEALELQLGKMIYQVFAIANRFRAIDVMDHRKQEREWEEQKRKRHLEQMRRGELEKVRILEQVISD
jgi:hypothetical protein